MPTLSLTYSKSFFFQIKISLEYPLRPPQFELSLYNSFPGKNYSEAICSEFFNELSAMEAEVSIELDWSLQQLSIVILKCINEDLAYFMFMCVFPIPNMVVCILLGIICSSYLVHMLFAGQCSPYKDDTFQSRKSSSRSPSALPCNAFWLLLWWWEPVFWEEVYFSDWCWFVQACKRWACHSIL